jgi:hypothetical protein
VRTGASSLALFSEPARGTHVTQGRLMILGILLRVGDEPMILAVDQDGHPAWCDLDDVTFDWRWSPELGRWADLEELDSVTPAFAP